MSVRNSHEPTRRMASPWVHPQAEAGSRAAMGSGPELWPLTGDQRGEVLTRYDLIGDFGK